MTKLFVYEGRTYYKKGKTFEQKMYNARVPSVKLVSISTGKVMTVTVKTLNRCFHEL